MDATCPSLQSLVTVLVIVLFALPVRAEGRDPYENARLKMVSEYIAAEGVMHEGVLEAMRGVPRHLFVSPKYWQFAYFDQALDIGHKQTISPPFIVAYMTEMLDPQPTDKVLEIGTGSGYQAAVLSKLVREVYTIEIVEPLGKQAAALLKRLRYQNVHCKVGDGYLGWPQAAPFDKIIVTCSPESVPQPLVEQLKEGGKMIIPLGERYQQVFYLLEKRDGELRRTRLIPTLFVPMTGTMEQLRTVQPDATRPQLVNGGFELDEDGNGLAEGWHYQRRSTLVRENAPEGETYIRFENAVPGRSAHMLQGFAVDGTNVERLVVTWMMRSENVRRGTTAAEAPFLAVYFFGADRTPIGSEIVGPWLDDHPAWTSDRAVVSVPQGAREAIIQVGLNGATGVLCLDAISLQGVRR